jgi:uncharacterized protein
MLLDLRKIRTPHEKYERTFDAAAFAPDEDYAVVAPVHLIADIFKDKDTFRLVGRVQSVLELPCSRCLDPFRLTVDEPFELTYQPRAAATADETDRELHDTDSSVAFYENDELDLEQLLRERFELSLPMKPLCRDDCRGLCPVCGTNLNRETCACKTGWDDPRFAALKELKIKADA